MKGLLWRKMKRSQNSDFQLQTEQGSGAQNPVPNAIKHKVHHIWHFGTWVKARKKLSIIIAVILLFGFLLIRSKSSSQTAILVSSEVKRGAIKNELTLSGKVDADDHAILQFPGGGRLAWVGVKKGDHVVKGQMIAYLDAEKLQAAVRQAEQNFTAAAAEHEKYYDKHDNDPESFDEKIERTAIDAKQNIAYDSLRIAQENLRDATLYSPIEGIVTRIDVPNAGANILPTQIFEIVNPVTLYFSVTADQTDVINIKENQKGIIVFDSYPEEQVTGVVKSISFTPRTDEAGTTYEVKVALDSKDSNKYRLGMTGDITFITQELHNTLYVPSTFIKTDDTGKYMLLGKEKKKVYVKTGLETDTQTEIKSGLSEGDLVYD